MNLQRGAALGLMAAIHLAKHGRENPLQGREVADALGVHPDYMIRILQQLVKARILISKRGPAGGFMFRGPPEDVAVLTVVEAIEGPIHGVLVIEDEVKGREQEKARLASICRSLAAAARSILGQYTVRDLMS